MDSFLFFWDMHSRASFWRIFHDGYRPRGHVNLLLSAYSIVSLIILFLLAFTDNDLCSHMIDFLIVAVWALLMWKGIQNAYHQYFEQYSALIHHYRHGRQFLRYLIFRDEILNNVNYHYFSIYDAIAHIDSDLETEVSHVLITSFFISTIVTFVSSLIVSLTSKLGTPYILMAIYISLFLALIGIVIIGLQPRSRKVKLLELKRYLIWLQQETAQISESR